MSPVGGKMSEAELSQALINAARTFGWLAYRTWNSIHSPRGYPDLTLVKPPRVIFAELKSDSGKVTPEQEKWLAALRELPQAEVFVWRPADLEQAYRILMHAK